MNEQAREVLVAAALRGHPQVKGARHNDEGECALGVLHLALHGSRDEAVACYKSGPRCWGVKVRDVFSVSIPEQVEIIDANDWKGWDFLTIARKCGVNDAG